MTNVPGTDNINALVARYARIGQRQRRNRWTNIGAAVVLTPLIAIIGVKGTHLVTQQFRAQTEYAEQSSELRALGNQLRSEIDAVVEQRRELEQQSVLFDRQSALLASRLSELDAQRTLLEQQGQTFDQQRDLLAAALEKADRQRIDLAQQRAEYNSNTPAIEREIAAINAQRLQLQDQQRNFKAQSDQLADELSAINAQRRELEMQKQQVEEQRRAVNEILEQVSALRDRQRNLDSEPEFDSGRQDDAVAYSVPVNPTLDGMATLGDSTLGNMRGGISIGGEMDITVGLTRSASINGAETYSNSLNFENLNASLSPSDLSSINSVLIQNGAGNEASPAIVEALSGNYATVIQNSLDNQDIATQTVLDISIGNVSSAMRGLSAQQAVSDSLSLQR